MPPPFDPRHRLAHPTPMRIVTRAWSVAEEKPIWQRDYFDRQLRNNESYGEKWEYVRQNPVRAGLVKSPDAWPFQGEINVLPW
jgi:putative transposase